MHWLARELDGLRGLAERFSSLRAGDAGAEPLARQSRADFHQGIRTLVEQIAQRPGVTACFAAHEGLILAVAGQHDSRREEAWAAMGQVWLDASLKSARTLELGEVDQIVLVGRDDKLVLFPLGSVLVGVLSPTEVSLSRALAA